MKNFSGNNIFSSLKTKLFDEKNLAQGSIRFKLLLIPASITLVLGLGTICYIWDFYNTFKKIQTQDLRIRDLSSEITYLDEVLTSSARLFSGTSDPRWEERYLQYVPKLDKAIGEAQIILPDVFKSEALAKTNAANVKLVEMETKAFTLVHQGKNNEAKALLLSNEYEEQKKIYSQGLQEAIDSLKKYVENTIQNKSQQALWVIATIVLAIAILTFAWLAVFRTLRNYMQVINETGITIASTSNQLAATIQQQEHNISLQASSVNETTVTIDELSSSARQSAEQAELASVGARKALMLAEEGAKSVQDTITEMSQLKAQVNEIANQIDNLRQQTDRIGGISRLVGNLARQTNMLAINASVEAIRASDENHGFSVIANEIRQLAEQSKESADLIKNLVANIHKAIDATVAVTDEGNRKVDRGIDLTNATTERFIGVTDSINNIFLNNQQIFFSAKQQANAVQQVLTAMNAINLGAKDNATSIEQVQASTKNLKQAAQKLQEVL